MRLLCHERQREAARADEAAVTSYSLRQYDEDFARGEKLWRGGQFAAALEGFAGTFYRRLSALAAGKAEPPEPFAGDLFVIERVADAAASVGREQAADDMLAAYAGLARAHGNLLASDYGTLKRAHLALERGLSSDAERLLREMSPSIGDIEAVKFTPAGLDEWEAGRSWRNEGVAGRAAMFSLVYFVMGRLLAEVGQYREALVALRRGLHHARADAEDLRAQIRPRIKLALAAALLEAGDLSSSASALEELRGGLGREPYPVLHTRLLEISARLHMLRGELGAALEDLERARDLCIQSRLHRGELLSSLNLARLLIHLNQTNAARGLLTRVREAANASGEADVSADVSTLLGLADERGRSASGGVSEAPSLFNVRREVRRDGEGDEGRGDDHTPGRSDTGGYLARFELRTLDVYRLLGRRRFDAADALLSGLEKSFGLSDSALVRLRLRVLRAFVSYYLGRLARAEGDLGELLPALRERGLTPELWQAHRVLGWCWARLGRPREKQHALADETQRLLTQIADSLPASHRAFYLLDKWTADEDYIAAQIDHISHLRELMRGGPRLRRPARAWALMKRVNELLQHIDRYKDALAEGALEGREPKLTTGAGADGVPLWRRLLLHPLRRATVSFLVMPDRVLVASAGWLFLNFEVMHTPRLAVRDEVQNWYLLVGVGGVSRNFKLPDNFKAPGAPGKTLDPAAGRELVARLSEALGLTSLLRALPRRVKALTVIPDDALHGFPFAAASYDGKHLIESYALTFDFKTDGRAPAPDAEGHSRPALLVGVSGGAERFVLPATGEELAIRPLPYALKEVKQLGRWFEGRGVQARELTGDAATKDAVLEGLAASRYVHVACHGFFAHERPDSSGLILIPEPGRAEVLSLRELAGLRLEGLRHISLSSCSSADNFVLPGRWIISLPETLCRAGAQSVLGCMWEINDQFTASFMARFYWHLERHTREEALRRTQADCLRRAVKGEDGGPRLDGGGVDVTDPVNWAAYNLYGDHGRLRL